MLARSIADLENEKTNTQEELQEKLESRKHRCKRLEQKRKNAVAAGDNNLARNLKQEIEEEKKGIKQLEETIGRKGVFKMFRRK